jgi:hypothetical protein
MLLLDSQWSEAFPGAELAARHRPHTRLRAPLLSPSNNFHYIRAFEAEEGAAINPKAFPLKLA